MLSFTLVFLIIFYTGFFAYSNWNNSIAGQISYIIILFLIIYTLSHKYKIKQNQLHFASYIKFLILIPIISLIPSYIIYNQNPIESMKALFPNFLWLFYYFCHITKPKENEIIRILLCASLCIVCIQIVQQFVSPSFGISYNQSGEVYTDIRNGIYRYRVVFSGLFTLIILYYYWELLKRERNIRILFITILMLTSTYLSLTRQLIFISILIIILSTFINKKTNKKRVTGVIFLLILTIILSIYSDQLFGDLINMTVEQSTEEDVRVVASNYYFNRLIEQPITFLLGNGTPAGNSTYQTLTTYEMEELGFYTSDVGFIGVWYKYGIIYTIIYYIITYKIFIKYRKKINTYLLMFYCTYFFLSIMIYPFYSNISFIIWSCIFYLTDKNINNNGTTTSNISRNTRV